MLGSPRLHRAASSIFGRKNIECPTIDQQIIPAVDILPNKIESSSIECGSTSDYTQTDVGNRIMESQTNEMGATKTPLITSSPDQNIQYPPVFVPETYSLRDPNSNQINL